MDTFYIERMKSRLVNMRKVAALAHDPRIIQLVTETAEQLEEDIRKLEAEASVPTTVHIEPPSDG
jgi:vacuolar-type H+-ATPase subunit F/Vma7